MSEIYRLCFQDHGHPMLVGSVDLDEAFTDANGAADDLRARGLLASADKSLVGCSPAEIFGPEISSVTLPDDGDELEVQLTPWVVKLQRRGQVLLWTLRNPIDPSQATIDVLLQGLEEAGEVALLTSSDGAICYVNRAFERVTGYLREEVLGENPRLLKSGKHDADFYTQMWRTLCEAKTWRGRIVNKRKDGTFYQHEPVITPVHGGDGEVSHYLALSRDVTRSLQVERELRQFQELAAMGQLAGGVAHNFNNLFTMIISLSQVLSSKVRGGRPVDPELAEEVGAIALRGTRLTNRLLAFSEQQRVRLGRANVGEWVRESKPLIKGLLRPNTEITLQIEDRPSLVRMDPFQLKEALVHLVENAREALPEHGGSVTVDVRRANVAEHEGEGLLEGHVSQLSDCVRIRVSDNGCGMDGGTLKRCIEPFFSTKSDGLGLGLAVVLGIIRRHGGALGVRTPSTGGTEVALYFPISGQSYFPPAMTSTEVESSNMLGRPIVLVDADPATATAMASLLRGAGFGVRVVASLAQAQAVSRAEPISVMIADLSVGLSALDWPETMRWNNGKRLLFLSDVTTISATDVPIDSRFELLKKPITREGLIEKVTLLLEE